MTRALKSLWCALTHDRYREYDGPGLMFYDRHKCSKCGTVRMVGRLGA